MMPWREPFEELQMNVQKMIRLTAIFSAVIALIALTALILVGVVGYKHVQANKRNVERNQATIVALCRQLNADNSDMLIYELDKGASYFKLQFLLPKDCTPAKLRERYGITR